MYNTLGDNLLISQRKYFIILKIIKNDNYWFSLLVLLLKKEVWKIL